MDKIFERLSKLQGSWKGRGHGKFPIIDSFEYEEHLRFEVHLAYPLIRYEQKTILLPTKSRVIGSLDLLESLMMALLKYQTLKIAVELRFYRAK